jgi:single-strand DNA-binding protein
MAQSINSVVLIGNLTKDPETRQAGETSVTQLRIAVNDRRKVGGEWTDVAGYFDVDVFGQQGENCAKYLSRGKPVGVKGRLQFREWETDNGKRNAVSIVADLGGVQFLGSKDDGPSEPEPEAPASSVGF